MVDEMRAQRDEDRKQLSQLEQRDIRNCDVIKVRTENPAGAGLVVWTHLCCCSALGQKSHRYQNRI